MPKIHLVIVFGLTFLSYAAYPCSRTYWAYIQDTMHNEFDGYTDKFTGIINLCFLFLYAVSMKFLGPMGGKWNLSYLFGIGSICAGISFGVIGIVQLMGHLNKYLVLVFMCLNGISQSTGWPSLVAIMGNYFKRDPNVGLIMGIWVGTSNFGDVLGLLLGDIVLERLKWQLGYGIIISASFLILVGLMDILVLQPVPMNQSFIDSCFEPPRVPQSVIDDCKNPDDEQPAPLIVEEQQEITFYNVWKVPGVLLYTIGYMCLKGTFLGFLYWLPTYFQQYDNLSSQSSYISSMFDYGSFIGGMIIGYVGDKFGKRAVFICPSLALAAGFMLGIKYGGVSTAWYYYVMILSMGFFFGGPYNNISGCISIELTKTKELKGNKRATSLVSSIIEGFGSFTGAVFQLIIPIIGSSYLFLLFSSVTGIAEITAIFLMIKELKQSKVH